MDAYYMPDRYCTRLWSCKDISTSTSTTSSYITSDEYAPTVADDGDDKDEDNDR